MKLLALYGLTLLAVLSIDRYLEIEVVVHIYKEDSTAVTPLRGEVAVYADNKLINVFSADTSGKVPPFTIPLHEKYVFLIRSEGYVTKMAHLDGTIDIPEDAPNPLYLSFQTNLFERLDDIDYSYIENNPLVKFYFDSEYYYRYDQEYTREMVKKVQEIRGL